MVSGQSGAPRPSVVTAPALEGGSKVAHEGFVDEAHCWHVDGAVPWFDALDAVAAPGRDRLDALVGDFMPFASRLATQQAFWVACHYRVVERVVSDELQGIAPEDVRDTIGAVYASAYWCAREMALHFGLPPVIANVGATPAPPNEASVAGLVADLTRRHDLLRSSDTDILASLPSLLREEPVIGFVHGFAYNAGYCEAVTERPPLGEVTGHLESAPGSIRVNRRDVVRADYAMAVPAWLHDARRAFETAVRAAPDRYERLLTGDGDQRDVRDIWADGLEHGHINWGASSGAWTQAYLDDTVEVSLRYNFAVEGIALAAISALLDGDEARARRVVRANTVLLPSYGAALMAFLDLDGGLPEVRPA
jgi:hypothetical protein